MPKSRNTVRTLVMQYGKKVRQVVVNEMLRAKSNGKKFSLTFDEWSSIANRRYMNVNVHGVVGTVWSLGLVCVSGSMPSAKCIQLVENKLKENGLSLQNDIVCITTDGASLMTKVGKSIAAFHQLCYAHGVQLGILDVMYKKKTEVEHSAAPEGFEDESVELEMESSQSDPSNSMVAASPASAETAVAIPEGMELSMHVEEIEETGGLAFLDDDDIEGNLRLQVFPELEENLDCLILKVRKVVCMFKNSPTRNDEFLQKHVRDEFGKELRLLLDTKNEMEQPFQYAGEILLDSQRSP